MLLPVIYSVDYVSPFYIYIVLYLMVLALAALYPLLIVFKAGWTFVTGFPLMLKSP